MSQQIIDRIKEAEQKAHESVEGARLEADRIKAAAGTEARDSYNERIKEARAAAKALIREAEERARSVIEAAEQEASAAGAELRSAASARQSEAIDRVIDSLFKS